MEEVDIWYTAEVVGPWPGATPIYGQVGEGKLVADQDLATQFASAEDAVEETAELLAEKFLLYVSPETKIRAVRVETSREVELTVKPFKKAK